MTRQFLTATVAVNMKVGCSTASPAVWPQGSLLLCSSACHCSSSLKPAGNKHIRPPPRRRHSAKTLVSTGASDTLRSAPNPPSLHPKILGTNQNFSVESNHITSPHVTSPLRSTSLFLLFSRPLPSFPLFSCLPNLSLNSHDLGFSLKLIPLPSSGTTG